eukprot:886094-Rhodomonas_salina.2
MGRRLRLFAFDFEVGASVPGINKASVAKRLVAPYGMSVPDIAWHFCRQIAELTWPLMSVDTSRRLYCSGI